MAKINKMILGKVSGSLGDITFRQRNGKNYLSSRPANFKVSDNPATLERRSKFKFSGKLASLIVSIPELYLVWCSYFGKGVNPYNKLIQKNYSKVNTDSFTNRSYLVPELGFGLRLESSSILKTGIEINLLAIGNNTSINISEEPSIRIFSIICFSNPITGTDDPWLLIPLQSSPISTVLETPLQFSIEPSSNIEVLFDQYNKKQLLFCLLTIDSSGSPVHWSGNMLG